MDLTSLTKKPKKLEAEAFKLTNDGKWNRFPLDAIMKMSVSGIHLIPLVMKIGEKFYCSTDSCWNKLEGKDRGWIHDLVIDAITENEIDNSQWLHNPINKYLNI